MKKRLLLLPLTALMLTGCKITLFGKTIYLFEKNPGEQEEVKKDYFEFVPNMMKTPYFGDDPRTPQEFQYEGMTFTDRQAYYATNKDVLWFFNKWTGNPGCGATDDDKVTSETVFAFLANKTAFEKGISKIEITTNAGTGKARVHVKFGSSAFAESQQVTNYVQVQNGVSNTYTFTGDGTSKYFCISPRTDVGYYLTNLMVDSIKVYFAK